uniref:Bestrophin homolog n=1 Tax=Parascaris univalens TaxID=6257 RepID=A0A915BB44_PARUN
MSSALEDASTRGGVGNRADSPVIEVDCSVTRYGSVPSLVADIAADSLDGQRTPPTEMRRSPLSVENLNTIESVLSGCIRLENFPDGERNAVGKVWIDRSRICYLGCAKIANPSSEPEMVKIMQLLNKERAQNPIDVSFPFLIRLWHQCSMVHPRLRWLAFRCIGSDFGARGQLDSAEKECFALSFTQQNATATDARFITAMCQVSSTRDSFLLPHELEMLEGIDLKYNKYFVPFNWIFSMIYKLRKEGKIDADVLMNSMLQEIRLFRTNLAELCNYDWVPVPLAYPQIDLRVPFMTMLQFVFYMGWVKVAEAMLNPMGENDDDFEGNFLIDKNITTALRIVDDGYDKFPEQKSDSFMSGQGPLYSTEAAKCPMHQLVGSVASVTPRSSSLRQVLKSSVANKANIPERSHSVLSGIPIVPAEKCSRQVPMPTSTKFERVEEVDEEEEERSEV